MSVKTLQEKAVKRMGAVKEVVKEKVLDLIKQCYDEDIYVLITDGYRSNAEQDELYAQGRTKPGNIVTNAKGGQSNHNKGIAVDYCLTNKEGTAAYWTVNTDWKRVATIAKTMGFEWGGDWKGFVDNPHLEYTGKVTVEEEAKSTTTKKETYTLPTGTYKKGSKGDAIKQIQEALNKLYFKCGTADGIWGAKTDDALRRFQSVYCNPVDGVYGKNTRAAMLKQLNK